MNEYTALLDAAREAKGNAYAPYSGFHVGAALLTKGAVYTGCNVENASYGGCICAERTAAVKAVSAGERDFLAIAISADTPLCTPCGICRQFLTEFGDMDVIMENEGGEPVVLRLSDLLPAAFSMDGH